MSKPTQSTGNDTASPASSSSSSSSSFLDVERRGQYAVLTLRREPVNSMNLAVWTALLSTLTELEEDKTCRGLIIQSGLKRGQHNTMASYVFTAGNDINESDLRFSASRAALYAPSTSRARYLDFWRAQTVFLSRLYRSPLITIALIRGSCPAGGCITALCCDYRLINQENNPTIGLNEVALGIPVPRYWARVMSCTVGQRHAERILARGQLVECRLAGELGLVDEVVERDQLMVRGEAEMRARLKFPDVGRVVTKLSLRAELSREWEGQWEKEATEGWEMLTKDTTVAFLGQVLKRLSGGKNRPTTAKGGGGAGAGGQQTGSGQQEQVQAKAKL